MRWLRRLLLGLFASLVSSGDGYGASGSIDDPIWMRYEFVPGDQVLFVEDFSTVAAGARSPRFDTIEGAPVVVDHAGRRVLQATAATELSLSLNEALPPYFTVQFDLEIASGTFDFEPYNPTQASDVFTRFRLTESSAGIYGRDIAERSARFEMSASPHQVAMSVDAGRARLWVDGVELCEVPTSHVARSNQIRLRIAPSEGSAISFGNLRIARTSRPLLATKLTKQAPFITHGIRFDGDRLAPESAPIIRFVVDALRHDPALKLRLEIHGDGTEGDGTALLTAARQAKVLEQTLRTRGGIADGQWRVEGVGNREPILPGSSPEARWANRRVMLIPE
ncbi:MAG: hypothetical protein IPK72_01485 [Candidatus Eisenbacteria bacterium]|nr:hypothetical protein [Candidatus Eisenbacteria bacterium]